MAKFCQVKVWLWSRSWKPSQHRHSWESVTLFEFPEECPLSLVSVFRWNQTGICRGLQGANPDSYKSNGRFIMNWCGHHIKAMRACASQQQNMWKWAVKIQNGSSEISLIFKMGLKINLNKGV